MIYVVIPINHERKDLEQEYFYSNDDIRLVHKFLKFFNKIEYESVRSMSNEVFDVFEQRIVDEYPYAYFQRLEDFDGVVLPENWYSDCSDTMFECVDEVIKNMKALEKDLKLFDGKRFNKLRQELKKIILLHKQDDCLLYNKINFKKFCKTMYSR